MIESCTRVSLPTSQSAYHWNSQEQSVPGKNWGGGNLQSYWRKWKVCSVTCRTLQSVLKTPKPSCQMIRQFCAWMHRWRKPSFQRTHTLQVHLSMHSFPEPSGNMAMENESTSKMWYRIVEYDSAVKKNNVNHSSNMNGQCITRLNKIYYTEKDKQNIIG